MSTYRKHPGSHTDHKTTAQHPNYNKTNFLKMIRILTAFALIGLPATLMAFSTHPNKIMTRYTTTLYYHPAAFERAVDCAQNYGMCDVDELLNLAERECLLYVLWP
jgi:hypothetical protein